MIEVILNPSEELHFFKSKINLADFLEREFGFEVKSAKENSYVMRRDDLEVYVSFKNGVYVYKSFQSKYAEQQGTIIDFLAINTGESLGRIRMRLRPFLGLSRAERPKPIFIQNTSMFRSLSANLPAPDSQFSESDWLSLADYDLLMLSERGISNDVLSVFNVKKDARYNACFVHRDRQLRITGYERVNKNFKGFTGKKSLMLAGSTSSPKRLIVTESSIDAMSYMQLNGRTGDLYVSMSGKASKSQLDELFSVAQRSRALLICAHDADDAGDAMAKEILSSYPGVRHRPESSPGVKDWNDILVQMLKVTY